MDNMRYKRLIIDRCEDLINSGKKLSDCNNYDLAKIFEYYSSIKLYYLFFSINILFLLNKFALHPFLILISLLS